MSDPAVFSTYVEAYLNTIKAPSPAFESGSGAPTPRYGVPYRPARSPVSVDFACDSTVSCSQGPHIPVLKAAAILTRSAHHHHHYHLPQPKKTTSVLHRPAKHTSHFGLKNVENLDVQFQKDKDSFDRHASIYRKQANEHHKVRMGSGVATTRHAQSPPPPLAFGYLKEKTLARPKPSPSLLP